MIRSEHGYRIARNGGSSCVEFPAPTAGYPGLELGEWVAIGCVEYAAQLDLPRRCTREWRQVRWQRLDEWDRLPVYDGRTYWLFRDRLYSTVESLEPREIMALILERENKTKMRLARAVALMDQVKAVEEARAANRKPIPDDVKLLFVWQRDGGKCVTCGSNRNLEFDHIIPVVMGGFDTARNLQLLCEGCNRAKGGNLA